MSSSSASPNWFDLSHRTLIRYLYDLRCSPTKRSYIWLRRLKWLQFAFMLIELLRSLYLSELSPSSMAAHLPYNPLMTGFIMQFRFFTGATLKAASMTIIFIIHTHYSMYFKLDHFLLHLFHQLMAENAEAFLATNERVLSVPQWNWHKPVRSIRNWHRLLQRIWHSKSKLKFKPPQLASFPHISTQCRARLFVYSTTIGWLFTAFSVFAALVMLSFGLLAAVLLYSQVPLWVLPIAGLEGLFLCYYFWKSIHLTLFGLHCCSLIGILCSWQLSELTASLRAAVQQSQLVMLRYRFMSHFYGEYHRHKYLAEYTNRLLVSPSLAITFFSHISLNVAAIGNLLFMRLYITEQIFLYWLISVQTFLFLQYCSTFIRWSNAFYRCEHTLFRAQPVLASRHGMFFYRRALLLAAKLKLMAFYELVCTKAKFRFTMGPFGKISKRSVYEFLYFYSGLVMYVAKMVHKSAIQSQMT